MEPEEPGQLKPSPAASVARSALARQCRFEFFRGSGPGGQHRNKVETGVRVHHLPTGLKAQASERRSREQNRAEALKRLAALLERRLRRRRPRIPTSKPAAVKEKETEAKRRQARKKVSRRGDGLE